MGVGGEELLPPQQAASFQTDAQPPLSPAPRRPPKFDPSRMIGIIRRKALIKDLAAVYHAECLAYCQELLELQTKWEEGIQSLLFRGPKRPSINPSITKIEIRNLSACEADERKFMYGVALSCSIAVS